MAKPHQRVFALITAVLFLATAVAGGAVVIWQIKKDNDTAKLLKEATTAQTPEQAATQTTEPKEGKLEGTKLAGFTPQGKVQALQIVDLVEGTGEVVKAGATVTAHYTGALVSDGTIFQSSHDAGEAVEFPLSGVIKGWTDGVPGMKVGGKRRLIIPADQAYAGQSRPGIPANSDLVFDIEMVSVKQ